MKRETGYYWCKLKYSALREVWAIYYWSGGFFWNGDMDYSEDCFDEIDEHPIIRKPSIDISLENKSEFKIIDGSKLPELKNLINPNYNYGKATNTTSSNR